jgi:hypothetical protein
MARVRMCSVIDTATHYALMDHVRFDASAFAKLSTRDRRLWLSVRALVLERRVG